MEVCLSLCQHGCHISVLKWFPLLQIWESGHSVPIIHKWSLSVCTQAHQLDITYPHFTDQTSPPAFAHLYPGQIFYFSSSFVKCDSQGYTWWIAPPPSQQQFSNFLVIWCRNLLSLSPPFLIFPPLDWQCVSRLNSAGKAGELQKSVRLYQV